MTRTPHARPMTAEELAALTPEPTVSPWVARALTGTLPASNGALPVRWPADEPARGRNFDPYARQESI